MALDHAGAELGARGDAELAVDAREVGLDRLRAHVQRARHLAVRAPAGGERRHDRRQRDRDGDAHAEPDRHADRARDTLGNPDAHANPHGNANTAAANSLRRSRRRRPRHLARRGDRSPRRAAAPHGPALRHQPRRSRHCRRSGEPCNPTRPRVFGACQRGDPMSRPGLDRTAGVLARSAARGSRDAIRRPLLARRAAMRAGRPRSRTQHARRHSSCGRDARGPTGIRALYALDVSIPALARLASPHPADACGRAAFQSGLSATRSAAICRPASTSSAKMT